MEILQMMKFMLRSRRLDFTDELLVSEAETKALEADEEDIEKARQLIEQGKVDELVECLDISGSAGVERDFDTEHGSSDSDSDFDSDSD